jgi:hypothetical protein
MILAAKPGGTEVTGARQVIAASYQGHAAPKGRPLPRCNNTPKSLERPLRAGFGWS